jgi:hypothetical protein
MHVEYSDGRSEKFLAESEAELIKLLEREMMRPDFKTAQVFIDVVLPPGVVNNRKNRRKHLYTNNPKHTDAKREASLRRKE